MSWFPEKQTRTWMQKTCEAILKSGPVPKHIAIIMDGNRRFAVKTSIKRAEGHIRGFDKLAETLDWCLGLGITEVTVYAFSIENFKRTKEEVDGLMELARKKFARLMEEKDMINKRGVCVRVLGDVALLAPDLQKVISDAVDMSKHNTKAILNVCFAYTARDDIASAMREISHGVGEGVIRESDISLDLLEKCLYTSHSCPLDMLIRTSGEVRLSDFMLWQSSYGVLSFVRVLWPEFNIWHLYNVVLHFQRNFKAIQAARQNRAVEQEHLVRESDRQCAMLELTACGDAGNTANIQERVGKYTAEREARIGVFIQSLNQKRSSYFSSLANQTSVSCSS